MANYDRLNDPTPKLVNNRVTAPTISALRAAIAGSPQAASYPTSRLDTMTENDMIYVCKVHGIAVAGL